MTDIPGCFSRFYADKHKWSRFKPKIVFDLFEKIKNASPIFQMDITNDKVALLRSEKLCGTGKTGGYGNNMTTSFKAELYLLPLYLVFY
jgi:hypothetical protein